MSDGGSSTGVAVARRLSLFLLFSEALRREDDSSGRDSSAAGDDILRISQAIMPGFEDLHILFNPEPSGYYLDLHG